MTYAIDLDFKASGVDKSQVLSLDKTTGKVVPLALQSLGGTKARLMVTLAPGDVILFKYATGHPFALGK